MNRERFFTIWKPEEPDPLEGYSKLSDEIDYKQLTNDEEKREVLNKIINRTFNIRKIYDGDYSECIFCKNYTSNYCGSCIGCPHLICKNVLHKHIEKPKNKCCVII